MPGHPNTTAGTLAGAFTVVALYVAGKFGLNDVSPEVAAAFTTLVVGVVLFIGRKRA
jgi:hypothetical protein